MSYVDPRGCKTLEEYVGKSVIQGLLEAATDFAGGRCIGCHVKLEKLVDAHDKPVVHCPKCSIEAVE